MSAKDHIIEIQALHTQLGQHVVHRDINLAVRHGEVLSFVGSSGSGKTTLLRQILGLEQYAQGSVKVFGYAINTRDASQLNYIRRHSGVLFQQGALFSALSVFDNVALPLRELQTLNETMIRDLVMYKLEMVAIAPEHADKMPSDLSGGMVKRVALARALALEPELLLLDEPTAGLDPELSKSFVRLIERLRVALSLTIVMVTHDLDTLQALSDRIAVFADQTIVAIDTPEAIYRHPHPYIQRYFSGVPHNLL